MLYLFAQIIVILIFSAIFGGVCVYFWLRKSYEDVTESYTQLQEQQRRLSAPAQIDLQPVFECVQQVSARVDDLGKQLFEQLSKTNVNLSPVTSQVDSLKQDIATLQGDLRKSLPDLQALKADVARLQSTNHDISLDLRPMITRFQEIEEQLAESPASASVDVSALEARLQNIEEKLTVRNTTEASNLDTIEERLNHLEDSFDEFVAAEEDDDHFDEPMATDEDEAPVISLSESPPEDNDHELLHDNEETSSLEASSDPTLASFDQERRTDGSKNLLKRPAFGAPDNLRLIAGVGPVLESTLHDLGVYYFWQIADWHPEDINFLDARLQAAKGRIRRDDWVAQAKDLQQSGCPRPRDAS